MTLFRIFFFGQQFFHFAVSKNAGLATGLRQASLKFTRPCSSSGPFWLINGGCSSPPPSGRAPSIYSGVWLPAPQMRLLWTGRAFSENDCAFYTHQAVAVFVALPNIFCGSLFFSSHEFLCRSSFQNDYEHAPLSSPRKCLNTKMSSQINRKGIFYSLFEIFIL